MLQTARSHLFGGVLFTFLLLSQQPLWAAVGAKYSFQSFKPYLAREYNTLLGWQGQPVSLEDPHLYLHSGSSQRLLAELEFVQAGGLIRTQTLKLYPQQAQLQDVEFQEILYFALEASHHQLDQNQLKKLLNANCQGEWRLGTLFLTLMLERQAIWLRLSAQGSAQSKEISSCRQAG